jgi:hypothetical protein
MLPNEVEVIHRAPLADGAHSHINGSWGPRLSFFEVRVQDGTWSGRPLLRVKWVGDGDDAELLAACKAQSAGMPVPWRYGWIISPGATGTVFSSRADAERAANEYLSGARPPGRYVGAESRGHRR